ncbi:hypothetical protein J6590_060307 [Homalodisca vitripennis]|nr:hypothetical protein J6590_060307 [Homalodisca vitripennis]
MNKVKDRSHLLCSSPVEGYGTLCNVTLKEALFCPSSRATGLCKDLIKQNKGEEGRYSTRLIVLIKSTTVTDRI